MKSKTTYHYLLMLFLLVFTVNANAQVAGYGFSHGQGTYQELQNPELIVQATSTTDDLNNTRYQINLPFAFPFNNQNQNSLWVHSGGFVSFGANAPFGSSPISNNVTTFDGAISALGASLSARYSANDGIAGNIAYEMVGEAPYREFVIQWKNFGYFEYSHSTTRTYNFNFQIRLSESGGISMVYDLSALSNPSSFSAQVGLRGASNTEFNNRYAVGSASGNFTSTTPGGANSSVIFVYYNLLPPSGYTFTWTTPEPCVTPAAQPENLALTVAGTTVNGTFTAAADTDRYLVVRIPVGTTPELPVNGTTYNTGAGLGGYIVANGSNASFTSSSLTANTEYTFIVYSYNSLCSGGPLYNVTDAPTANITTCPAAPTLPNAVNPSQSGFDMTWTASAVGGNAQPFSYVVEVTTDSSFNNHVTGSPFTTSETNYTVTGIGSGTKYYYRIKAVAGSCSSAYTSSKNITTLCQEITSLPYTEGFNNADFPACWSTATVSGSNNWAISPGNAEVPVRVSGTRYANKTWTNSNALLISPKFNLSASGIQQARVNVWIYRNGTNGHATDVVKIHVNTEEALTGAEELLSVGLKITANPVETTGGWHNYMVDIPASYNNTPFYVIIQGTTGGSGSSYGLGIDEFVLEEAPSIVPESITISTENNIPAAITINDGTLQLQASVAPAAASQDVTWSIINGTGQATISETGLVTAVNNGTVTAKATSVDNVSLSEVLDIVITNQIPEYCTPNFSQGVEPITFVEFYNLSKETEPTSAEAYIDYTNFTANVNIGNDYNLTVKGNTDGASSYFKVYFDWDNNGIFDDSEGISLGYINNSTGIDEKKIVHNIVIPDHAHIGNVRMRVLKKWQSSVIPACNTDSYGQAQDFTLIVSEAVPVVIESVTVTTLNNIPAQITTEQGTLQLQAVVAPVNAPQTVSWSIISGSEFASVSENGLVTAISNGTAVIRATSTENNTVYGEISVIVNVTVVPQYCVPGVMMPMSITNVLFADITNPNNASPAVGYEDFTAIVGNVSINDNHTITVTGNSPDFYAQVYVDWNQNGTFETNELYSLGELNVAAGSGQFSASLNVTIPSTAIIGTTRMRVMMKLNNDNDACADLFGGQVEDYTLNVSEESMGIDDLSKIKFSIYPNPADDIITIASDLQVKTVMIYNQLGQLVITKNTKEIHVSQLQSGIYIVMISFENGTSGSRKIIKK